MKTDEFNKNFGDLFSYPYLQKTHTTDDENKEFIPSNLHFETRTNSHQSKNEEDDDCDLDFDALTKEFFSFNTQYINNDITYHDNDKSSDEHAKYKIETNQDIQPQKLTQKSVNIKEIINQKDIQLFTRIEEKLKNLSSIKDNKNKPSDQRSIKEVSLYEVCNKKHFIPPYQFTEKVKSPQRRNKFDEAVSRNNNHGSNIVSRLNINAQEFVPKKRKGMENDCINKIESSDPLSSVYIYNNVDSFSNWVGENDFITSNHSNSNLCKREYFN